RLIFILFGYARIPGIPQDVMQLFFQIAIRSNVAIESFFFPNCSGFPLSAVDLARGKRFQGTHQLRQRPECRFLARSCVFWPGLKERVDMVGHHAKGKKLVARVVKMTPCVQDDGSSLWTQAAPMRRCDCYGVNRPRLFEMW